MRFLAAILVVLIGIALLIHMSTGSLDPWELAGIGFIICGVAFFLPASWPNWNP